MQPRAVFCLLTAAPAETLCDCPASEQLQPPSPSLGCTQQNCCQPHAVHPSLASADRCPGWDPFPPRSCLCLGLSWDQCAASVRCAGLQCGCECAGMSCHHERFAHCWASQASHQHASKVSISTRLAGLKVQLSGGTIRAAGVPCSGTEVDQLPPPLPPVVRNGDNHNNNYDCKCSDMAAYACFLLQVFVTFTVFGCLAILAGILTLLLPETCGAEMPETIEVSRMPRQWVCKAIFGHVSTRQWWPVTSNLPGTACC